MIYTKVLRNYCLQNPGIVFDISNEYKGHFNMIPYHSYIKILHRLAEEGILMRYSRKALLVAPNGNFDLDNIIFFYTCRKHRLSTSRNRKILDILYKSKDVEVQGSGIRKTLESCKNNNTKYEYYLNEFGFHFIFYRKNVTSGTINGTLKMNETDNEVIKILKEYPEYTKEQRTEIEFEIIKQRQTRIKCGFVSVFVLLEVINSRIKCEIFSLCNQLGIFFDALNCFYRILVISSFKIF